MKRCWIIIFVSMILCMGCSKDPEPAPEPAPEVESIEAMTERARKEKCHMFYSSGYLDAMKSYLATGGFETVDTIDAHFEVRYNK